MKTPFKLLISTLALASAFWLSACSSTRKDPNQPAGSTDILDLLTGFGESISKRDYNKAVGYLVPEERAQLTDSRGQVPEDKQKALSNLRLARLIRMPGVRVENGYLAGIYNLLPNEHAPETASSGGEAGEGYDAALEGMGSETAQLGSEGEAATEGEDESALASSENNMGSAQPNPALNQAVDKFFKAIAQKNWNAALNLMNENERRALTDDKGRLKDVSKARLQNIDTGAKEALTLQDGKLIGVTLLLPSE